MFPVIDSRLFGIMGVHYTTTKGGEINLVSVQCTDGTARAPSKSEIIDYTKRVHNSTSI